MKPYRKTGLAQRRHRSCEKSGREMTRKLGRSSRWACPPQ
ncbi:hypothetical protein LCGC14_2217500, partial [marine sediment metagenome]